MKQKEDKFKGKEYRLLDDRSGESFLLKVGRNSDLLVWDEKEGINRPIRHCPNERVIFVDKQSKHALVEPIIFRKGFLEVKRTDQITQQFLDAHPDNKANGGAWFESIDYSAEAIEGVEVDELQLDIKNAVRAKAKEKDGIYEIEAVVAVLVNSVLRASEMSLQEMKREIYNEVDNNPYYFCDDNGNISIFDDDSTKLKYLTLRAIKDGIIKKSPNNKSMLWVKNNELIASAPRGLDLVDYFSDYLSSDEGMLVIEEIKNRS